MLHRLEVEHVVVTIQCRRAAHLSFQWWVIVGSAQLKIAQAHFPTANCGKNRKLKISWNHETIEIQWKLISYSLYIYGGFLKWGVPPKSSKSLDHFRLLKPMVTWESTMETLQPSYMALHRSQALSGRSLTGCTFRFTSALRDGHGEGCDEIVKFKNHRIMGLCSYPIMSGYSWYSDDVRGSVAVGGLNNHKVKMPWVQRTRPIYWHGIPVHQVPFLFSSKPFWSTGGTLLARVVGFGEPAPENLGRMLLNSNDGLSHLSPWVQSNQSSAWRRYHLPPPGGDKATSH